MNTKDKTIKNIKSMNALVPLVDKMVDKYENIYEDASLRELLQYMGAQAMCLCNTATLLIEHAELDDLDTVKANMLRDKMFHLMENAEELIKGIDDAEEDDVDDGGLEPTEEDIQNFAEDAGLTKEETDVLRKIVNGKGNPKNMSKREIEIAKNMESKMDKMDIY